MHAIWIRAMVGIATLSLWMLGCGGGSGSSSVPSSTPTVSSPQPAAATYTVSGSISGLTSSSLVLQVNGGDNLTVAAGSMTFAFPTAFASGANYAVTVLSQPNSPAQNCTIANGSGSIAAANVTNVVVSCAAVNSPPPATSASSFDNIDAALASGRIDAETALVYKVFATFGDSRLPTEYKGNDDGIIDTPIMDEIAAQFDGLSASAKATIGPFLLRPNIAGSWDDPNSATPAATTNRKQALSILSQSRPTCSALNAAEWGFEDRAGVPIRVWAKTADAATAAKLADEIQNTIWPAFVAFHGLGAPLPLDDTNSGPTFCYGGDSKLDIYLTTLSGNANGLTVPEGSPNGGPVFVLMKHDHANIGPATAHEIMHVLQWAITSSAPQESYGWMRDALANWAIDMVYGKTNQFEQTYADCYMTTPELSLDDSSTGHCKLQPSSVSRDYGAYLYIQFLVRTQGGNVVAANILNAMTKTANGLKAVDAVSPFKDRWPEFAKALWNQDPINVKSGNDGFKIWDDLMLDPSTYPHQLLAINLNGQADATATLEGNIKHLAIHYYHYQITDTDVRSLIFFNHPYAIASVANFKVSTQAFIKIGGAWDYAHWSKNGKQDESKFYCLDVKAERIEELVVVLSNDSIDQDITAVPVQPRLSVSNVGCWEYKGTTEVDDDVHDPNTSATYSARTVDVVFKNIRYMTTPPKAPSTPGREDFKVESGTIIGTKVESTANCSTTYTINKDSGTGADPAIPTNDASSLEVTLGLADQSGAKSRAVSGTGTSMLMSHVVVSCNGTPVSTLDDLNSWDWLEFPGTNEKSVVVNPDGKLTSSFPRDYIPPKIGTRTMHWDLQPQREP